MQAAQERLLRNWPDLVEAFELFQSNSDIERLTFGLINESYRVLDKNKRPLFLQELKMDIFNNPNSLSRNISFIHEKLKQAKNNDDYPYEILTPIKTQSGSFNLICEDKFWRAFLWLPEMKTFLKVKDSNMAFQAAQAFGHYSSTLNESKPDELDITIKDFHNGNYRLNNFNQAVKADINARLSNCQQEVQQCQNNASIIKQLDHLIKDNVLPQRIIHSDTKISNLLFCEKSLQVRAVVDWDTTMPGSLLFDFGDMVRTLTCFEQEDSKQLSNVEVEKSRMQAVCEGFLTSIAKQIKKEERLHLLLGAQFMILCTAMRFLTDYLQGDIYFQTDYAEHNLDRTKNQLKLLSSLTQREREFKKFI